MSLGITSVDGPRLSRALFAAADWVAAGREEINRINVFPVPDGDTGTNFSLTLRTVADALRALGDATLPETAAGMARAAVLGARGNSGMMLAHFLLGFADALGDRPLASAVELAGALRQGADRLQLSVDDPREGTILTVARDAAGAAERAAAESADIARLMRAMLEEAEAALARTPEQMPTLKEAGVVDAGGKGFVRMLEGVVRVIDGEPVPAAASSNERGESTVVVPAARAAVAADRDYRFCTEVLVRGDRLPPANTVRAAMHEFGGSVVVAVMADILKIHVHTDTPEAVFSCAGRWGRIETSKADDMRAQHRRLAHPDRRAVAVVTDSSADLPDGVLDRYGISLIPLQVVFGEETFRDRVELAPEEFYRRLRRSAELPTTSQPTPADFVRVLRDAREEADEVVAVFLSASLSGTFGSAQAAVRDAGLSGVHLVDSRSASLGLGMLALRAAELADGGWTGADIRRELERVRGRSGMLLTVDRFDNLLRSGRVSRGKAWLGGMLDLKPILTLDPVGQVVAMDRIRGREQLVSRTLELLRQRLTPRPEVVRFGVAHAEAPEAAERVRAELVAEYRPRDCFVTLATGVLGAHVGAGAWAVFYQVEDGTPRQLEPAGAGGQLATREHGAR
ncbi:MAG TPA: DegV family protein [Gemmatimonadales bacterium]|jgi:DegV family protein with EDD domain|nr:DegV family protein [Gemmatimonadales bacterium]